MDKRSDKKVVRDIVATNRRVIHKTPVRHRVEEEQVEEEIDGSIEEKIHLHRIKTPLHSPQQFSSSTRPRRKIPTVLVTFVVVFIAIAIIAVALSLLYSKAVVTITPKTSRFDTSATITVKKISGTDFGYDVVTASETLVQTVPATSGPLIETKAKGMINLYNSQSTAQKIVAGTRLANTNGLIYRTTSTVVIPALRSSGIPGTIPVVILADQAGSNYNMSMSDASDFTVVAYKGGPKYTTVYGKLAMSLTGGFSGNKQNIDPGVQTAAVQSTEDTLKAKLIADAQKLVPKDSILYDNAYSIDYEVSDPVAKDKQTADISVKGTLYGADFNRNELLKAVAPKDLDKFSAPTYTVQGLDDLKFAIVNSKDFSPKKGNLLIFNIKGPITLTGTLSDVALKNELKGTYLKDSNTIFAHYPAIANAYALITPFWMRYFPNSPDKIDVEIKN